MRTILFTISFILFYSVSYAQQEPIKVEGNAQGTTYHITYFDKQNRNLQPEIEKILADFDQSVSTYIPTSIISRINSNQKNVIVDKYFKACFKGQRSLEKYQWRF